MKPDLVVDHLDAQMAKIVNLTVVSPIQTSSGDIAYHMELADLAMCKDLQEGVVVGFFPNSDGQTVIQPLTSDNSRDAVMAGVISRSAYLHAHAPSNEDKGSYVGCEAVRVRNSY